MTELARPLLFAPNRVWRCYTGGRLLDRFVGNERRADGHFPEDWLASTVRALNGEHSQGPDEGLACLAEDDGSRGEQLARLLQTHGPDLLGDAYVERFGVNLAPLCKYLDSAVRLPIQCHPDVPIARKLYDSDYGKTECWHILDTRSINGEEPYLLMGFKPGVTRKAFREAVNSQDIVSMEAMLHKLAPRPGETYFVPPRIPHAIGPGAFMLEVQEPSDWVVQPECYCADTRLSDADMWGPLVPEQGFDVFDYTGMDEPGLVKRVRAEEKLLHAERGGKLWEIIGDATTDAFAVQRAAVDGALRVTLPRPFAIVVVTAGRGRMSWRDGSRDIRRGQYFLQPAGVQWIDYTAREPLSLVLCLPPHAD